MRAKVVSGDTTAVLIWAGDLAPYPNLFACCGSWGEVLRTKYDTAERNPAFWASVSPDTCLTDVWGPLALHHSDTDDVVPVAWSETSAEAFEAVDSPLWAWHVYPGDNHNVSIEPGVALQRSVAFFDRYVKGERQ